MKSKIFLWRVLSSSWTTLFLLLIAFLLLAVAVIAPHGPEALAIAKNPEAKLMHQLMAWDLVNSFHSPWFHAVLVAVGINGAAVFLRLWHTQPKTPDILPPTQSPLVAHLTGLPPESAVEWSSALLREWLGTAPDREQVSGSRVRLLFVTGRHTRYATGLRHLGLLLLLLGVGVASQPLERHQLIPRAQLAVTHLATGTVGRFDIAEAEPYEFFQLPGRFILRDYEPSRLGLGPALRFSRMLQDRGQTFDFWVYTHAPKNFDRTHRKDSVAIEVLKAGLYPRPGEGMSSSLALVLVLLAIILMGFGWLFTRTASGYVWLEADAGTIKLVGQAATQRTDFFAAQFATWVSRMRRELGDV